MNNLFIIYKSSAGSGKTYTLVKEYLRIVLSQEEVTRYRNILAITFTNKASNEMKERILENLKKLSAPYNSPEFDANLLNDYVKEFNLSPDLIKERANNVFHSLLHNYSDLKVSTIDKFTHKIIRAFAKDLSLQPDFDIEMDGNTVLRAAINQVLSSVGKDDEISSTLTRTLITQIKNEKSWDVENNIFEFSKELIKEENTFFLNQLADLPSEAFTKATKTVISLTTAQEEIIKNNAKQIIHLIDKQGIVSSDFSRGTFYNFFIHIANGELKRLTEELATIEKAMDPSSDYWFSKAKEKEKGHLLEPIKEDIRSLYREIKENENKYFTYALISENIQYMELMKAIYKELNTLKEENGILLIADFNTIIAGEIQDQPAPFIYEKIGERYKNIMIDEFQDTSILQWQNLLPLVDNSLAQGYANLLVGDAKQAIYRFRGGKVEQFINLPQIYQHNNEELLLEREQALVYNHNPKNLETNFRSQKLVVEFNNWFFNQLKDYLPNQYANIYNEAEQKVPASKTGGYVNISFIDHKKTEDIKVSYVEETENKIQEVLNAGYAYKDIAILVRNNKDSALVADYLLEKDIPVITSESLVIHKNKTVDFVVNFLKVIANPNDNVAKLSLVKYLSTPNELSNTLLNNLLPRGSRNDIAFDEILKTLDKRLDEIATLDVSIYDLTEHIIRSFGLNQVTANPFLLCLLDKIHEITTKQNDLSYFINWWNDHGHKLSVNTPENTNAVTILTIHKSKGLQYPIVIMPFSNWLFKYSSMTSLQWIVPPTEIAKELPITVIPVKKEIKLTNYAYLLEEEEEVNRLDNFNLLYVALTRPEQALYVISDTDVSTSTNKESKTNLISTFIYQIACKHPSFNEEKNQLILGELAENKTPNTLSDATGENTLSHIISSNWREKVRISEVHKKHWNEGTYQESIEYGNTLHAILAKMEKKEDLPFVLSKMLQNGELKPDLKEQVEQEIVEIMQLPKVKEWFNGKGLVKNEEDLITENGQIIRPDKVILFSQKAIVIDFKTGEPNVSHQKQVLKYGNALKAMNYNEVEQYLLYTKYKMVEQVN